MLTTLGLMALEKGYNKKINLYIKHLKNKLQALTKADVTYEWNVTWSCNLHHRVFHEQGHLLLGNFLPCIILLYHV